MRSQSARISAVVTNYNASSGFDWSFSRNSSSVRSQSQRKYGRPWASHS